MIKRKVLFVCLGNICRSPMAEAIFYDKVRKHGLEGSILCHSAGTANYHIGELPDDRTIKVCKENGIEINHRGRQAKYDDFLEYDIIVAMDISNLNNLKSIARNEPQLINKIKLMRDYSGGNGKLEVPDPFYGNYQNFVDVYKILNESCEQLLQELIKKEGV